MRAVTMLTTAVTLLLVGSITPAPPVHAAPSCDVVGGNARDVVAGTRAREVICLLGGNDYAHGNGGNDRVRGGNGRDSLVGGAGRDRVKGGPGEDRLFATDQRLGNDVIRGGGGFDHCHADKGDLVRGCEAVHRGNVAATTDALTANSFEVTRIADDALETPPAGIPGPTGPPGPGVSIPPAQPPPCPPPPPPADPACP